MYVVFWYYRFMFIWIGLSLSWKVGICSMTQIVQVMQYIEGMLESISIQPYIHCIKII